MKKLERTIEVHSLRAKRALLLKQARKLEAEAAKFRADACEAGCQLTGMGEDIYNDHPIYHDMVYPYLKKARHASVVFGFDALYQTRTPLPGCPDFTHAIAGIIKDPTPAMKGCLDLIMSRPTVTINKDGTVSERSDPLHLPASASDNAIDDKASE